MARASLPRQATTPSRSTSGPASTQALTSARCSASSLRRRPERGWSPSAAGPPVRSRASQRYRVARPMPPARAALSTAMPSRTLAIASSRTRLRGWRSTRAKARSSVALTIPISTSAGLRKARLTNLRKPYYIDSVGAMLRLPEAQGRKLKIVGHTDARGSEPYNQALSERRAAAVRSYLKAEFGVAADQLEIMGEGETAPVAGSDPYDAENRRVEFHAG